MKPRHPSTEVLLLLAGAFAGPAGLTALVAALAALAGLPGLASTHMRAADGEPVLGLSLEPADVGPVLPAPVVATFADVIKHENLEGTPSSADIRRARRVNRKTSRQLLANPYFRLYKIAKRRFDVSWYLVASVHYQRRNAASHPRAAAAAVGSGLFRRGLGTATAWRRWQGAYHGIRRPARYPHRTVTHPSVNDDFDVIMAAAAELEAAGARRLGPTSWQALYKLYGQDGGASFYATTVLERARAWKQLGVVPLPGNGELALPVAGTVPGCGYFHCPRPGHLHNGLDLSAPSGTPIHAADSGTVAVLEGVSASGGYGNFICIQHREHLATCYAHLSAFAAGLDVGTYVERGQVIGLVGSTGHSTGAHLHFEVRRGPAACQACAVDPAGYLSGQVPDAPLPKFDETASDDDTTPGTARKQGARRSRARTGTPQPDGARPTAEPRGKRPGRRPELTVQPPPVQAAPPPAPIPAPPPPSVPTPSVPPPPEPAPPPPAVPPPSVPAPGVSVPPAPAPPTDAPGDAAPPTETAPQEAPVPAVS